MENFINTETNIFFKNITITLGQTDCFDQCYRKILAFLKQENISHPLPESLSWNHSTLNPDSFIYLNEYVLRMGNNFSWSVSGYIREHEPYHLPGNIIHNYLEISFRSSWWTKYEFKFAFFDGDIRIKNTAQYYFDIPKKYRIPFEKAINPAFT